MKQIAYLFLAVLIISGCKKTSIPKPTEPEKHGVDVYVSGTSSTSTKEIAGYWKNGTMITVGDPNSFSSADGIAVSGADVYVVGESRNLATNQNEATYWKNGIAHFLPDDNTLSEATCIAISGPDVYVGGYAFTSDGSKTGVYWKNGERHNLSSGSYYPAISAIAVIGTDVYTAGTVGDTNTVMAAYWKNGTLHNLTPTAQYAEIDGIATNGANVYFSGFIRTGPTWDRATYWKNETPTQIVPDTTNSFAYAIAVSGTDVYCGGSITYHDGSHQSPYSWKNGASTKMANVGVIYAMTINGADVYATGVTRDVNNHTTAAYWLNGTVVPLDGAYLKSDNSNAALPSGIVVVRY